MRKRTIYWLRDRASSTHEILSELLEQKGIETIFFNDIRSLLDHYNKKRVNVIVAGDDAPSEVVSNALKVLVGHPNLYGVRIIFSVSQDASEEIRFAYHLGCRDIIPFDLEHKTWVQRFLFSTSTRSLSVSIPHPQITLRSIAGVYVPGKIVWFGPKSLRIEARLDASVGAPLTLVGPLAQYLGVKSIQLVVEKREKTNLLYRFSDAYICTFQVPTSAQPKLRKVLEHFNGEKGEGSRIKVFAAVQSRELREILYESLPRQDYILATALSKNHIVSEPQYFSPDIVFMDATLVDGQDYSIFSDMLAALPQATPIVIVGNRSTIEDLRALAPGRRLFIQTKLRSQSIHDLIQNRFLKGMQRAHYLEPPGAALVRESNVFSSCEIYISARLKSVSPLGAKLDLPIEIGKFGFCRLESPFIQKATRGEVFGKITGSSGGYDESNQHPYSIEVLFCNTSASRRIRIARMMLDTLRTQLRIPEDMAKPAIESSKAIGPEPVIERTAVPADISPANEEFLVRVSDSAKTVVTAIRQKNILGIILPVLLMLTFIGAAGAALYWLTEVYAPTHEKSGGIFSRELERFKSKDRP